MQAQQGYGYPQGGVVGYPGQQHTFQAVAPDPERLPLAAMNHQTSRASGSERSGKSRRKVDSVASLNDIAERDMQSMGIMGMPVAPNSMLPGFQPPPGPMSQRPPHHRSIPPHAPPHGLSAGPQQQQRDARPWGAPPQGDYPPQVGHSNPAPDSAGLQQPLHLGGMGSQGLAKHHHVEPPPPTSAAPGYEKPLEAPQEQQQPQQQQ
eukprot:CAMPEP_0114115378 /NCGR_PEP_ID=MMETSP0043_2-20121206/3938_1 /TAXON_ID=464988 /ORGANISM="Hemiselmis andersenii, Strain CCMP644" /LENGTH=205 /DNA_ID=CAMNT_0001207639 /DNA_START=122 /DNA_END=742 /DNA_ORIENTATION=-